jgi:hypothetical protein
VGYCRLPWARARNAGRHDGEVLAVGCGGWLLGLMQLLDRGGWPVELGEWMDRLGEEVDCATAVCALELMSDIRTPTSTAARR